MITAKISIDCPVALQKGARKMARHIPLQFLLHTVGGGCFGQEENVGSLFNDLKFSSFNPLTSLSTLEDAPLLLSWLLVCHTGRHGGLWERSQSWGLSASDPAAVPESAGHLPNIRSPLLPPV